MLLHEISEANAASLLVRTPVPPYKVFLIAPFQNPLDILPLLLPCVDQAAEGILSLVGECCPSKEVVIAVQEAIEHVESSLNEEDTEEERKLSRTLPNQLITLVGLLTACEYFTTLIILADPE